MMVPFSAHGAVVVATTRMLITMSVVESMMTANEPSLPAKQKQDGRRARAINRIGQTFQDLRITAQWIEQKRRMATADCLRCGGTWTGRMDQLVTGNTKACGCLFRDLRMKDYVGQSYGTLTITRQWYDKGLAYVEADCTCGKTWTGKGSSLVHGATKSCGCRKLIKPRWQTAEGKRLLGVLHHQRRAARKKSLPDTFTKASLHYLLEFWDGACAVCGQKRGLLWTIALDHWVPLSADDCPGTIETNLVPLCHGSTGCNNSKRAKDPLLWLTEKLGTRAAKKKLREIEAYFRAAQAFVAAQEGVPVCAAS